MITEEEFSSKLDELIELSHSSEKIQKLLNFAEELENQEEWGFLYYVNMELSETANSIGEVDLFIDTFFWCLDLFDQNEDAFDLEQILWHYKWLLEVLHQSIRFSMEGINHYYEDFKNRLIQSDYSLRSYYQAMFVRELYLDHLDDAKQYFNLYKGSVRDDLSNCEKCEMYDEMVYHLKSDNIQEAVSIQEGIINSNIDCDEAIHKSYTNLLLPLLKENRIDEALLLQQKAYFVTYNRTKYIPELSIQIIFLTYVDPDRALELFYKHVDMCEKVSNLYFKFEFWLASLFMAKKLKINEDEFIFDLEKLEQIVYDLGRDFDKRNGNNAYFNRIESLLLN